MEQELLKYLPVWEEANERPFMVQGERVVDKIHNALEAKDQAKEAKKVSSPNLDWEYRADCIAYKDGSCTYRPSAPSPRSRQNNPSHPFTLHTIYRLFPFHVYIGDVWPEEGSPDAYAGHDEYEQAAEGGSAAVGLARYRHGDGDGDSTTESDTDTLQRDIDQYLQPGRQRRYRQRIRIGSREREGSE